MPLRVLLGFQATVGISSCSCFCRNIYLICRSPCLKTEVNTHVFLGLLVPRLVGISRLSARPLHGTISRVGRQTLPIAPIVQPLRVRELLLYKKSISRNTKTGDERSGMRIVLGMGPLSQPIATGSFREQIWTRAM